MRILDTFRIIAGSFTVYVAVAVVHACSAAPPLEFDGTGGAGGSVADGTTGRGGSSGSITDPVPPAAADPVNGSRLKGKYRVADDGSKEWAGWHDSQRNEDCQFRVGTDGILRCYPTALYAVGNFADSGCSSTPVAPNFECLGTPKYVLKNNDTMSYCPTSRLYAVGTKINSSTIYSGKPGACYASQVPQGMSYYTLGPEIPPSSFVSATISVE